MNRHTWNQNQLDGYHRDGFHVSRGLFDQEEMDLLLKIAKADQKMGAQVTPRRDREGGESKLWLTGELTETDIYSGLACCRRIVEPMEQMLGGDVYHYHHKMMVKEPRVGGAWEWHQDYGYRYKSGHLFPLMASCMIAVDRANQANGCLQVIPGSHLMGRIEHGTAGDQTGAELKRVEEALKHLGLFHCELEPGDALFFHSNLLHRSDQNRSENPRWSLICCYDAVRNPGPNFKPGPELRKLVKIDDDQIKVIGHRHWESMQTPAVT